MNCNYCNSKNLIFNYKLNSTLCENCGKIINENLFFNENYFTELNKLSYNNNNKFNNLLLSNQIFNREKKIKNLFLNIINILKLPNFLLEISMKYYKLCLNKNFSKGIKSKILCCVILYSICRLNNINILLIEFSNIIKINLFKLGTIYIKFIKLFDLNIPLLDSSLILKKLISKFKNFNSNEIQQINQIAFKILQCMKKNWLIEGRNPNGICAACIFISLKLNNFKTDDVCKIINISKKTINLRINEFKQSKFALLSKDELLNINLDNYEENNPPSFIKNRENDFKENNNKLNSLDFKKEDSNLFTNYKSDVNIDKNDIKNNNNNNDENLSELNDDEINDYLVNEDEYKIKKSLWEEKNKDWMIIENEKQLLKNNNNKFNSHLIENNECENNNNKYKNFKQSILFNNKFMKMRMKNKIKFFEDNLNN